RVALPARPPDYAARPFCGSCQYLFVSMVSVRVYGICSCPSYLYVSVVSVVARHRQDDPCKMDQAAASPGAGCSNLVHFARVPLWALTGPFGRWSATVSGSAPEPAWLRSKGLRVIV